ncbi:MAG: Gfo/Idh/MocA family oxidoreductase [Gemmatimonadota bacterium]
MSQEHESRREFVKRAALVGAGAPFLSSHLADLAMGFQGKPLGVALVGLGSLSTNQIAPALQKTKNCRLAGIVTGTPAKAAKWKAAYNIPDKSIYDYKTMSRMADNPDIDIVYVVTPNALHADHSIAAARAGKHVLCEKPMEISVQRCNEMIAASKKAGKQLAIGYRCQFEPHHLEAMRLVKAKQFGDLRLIDAAFGFSIGDPTQWRLNKTLSGGGPLMDVGIYALQSARMLTGEEPVKVSAIATKTDPVKFKTVEETMTFELTFPSGVLAHCATTYKINGLNRFTAIGDRGALGMEPAYNYNGNRGWRSDGQPLKFDEIDVFAAEMDDFARCIRSNVRSKVSGEEGLRDVRLLMAIYEAARTGRAVSV